MSSGPVGPRPVALVTGASGGIGEAFARRLAVDHDVVLVARSADRLEALATELSARHPGGSFRPSVADLSEPDGPARLVEQLDEVEVDLLVNNAGVGAQGAFAELDADRTLRQLQLNATSLVELTRAFLPGMLRRRRGGVVNVASTAAFQPTPSMAVYGASKAFVLSFTEAVAVEARGSGVRVLVVCPGATETGFFSAAGSSFLTSGRQSPEQVVDEALAAYARGRTLVVTGLANRLRAQGYRVVPRRLMARASARIVRRRD